MALIIHVCVYCLGVVMSSICISSAMHSYLFPLQRALSLLSQLSKKNLFVHVTMHACALLSRCVCASPVNSRVILHLIDWPHSTSRMEHV